VFFLPDLAQSKLHSLWWTWREEEIEVCEVKTVARIIFYSVLLLCALPLIFPCMVIQTAWFISYDLLNEADEKEAIKGKP
jgi:hypothetical protein